MPKSKLLCLLGKLVDRNFLLIQTWTTLYRMYRKAVKGLHETHLRCVLPGLFALAINPGEQEEARVKVDRAITSITGYGFQCLEVLSRAPNLTMQPFLPEPNFV
jgi:hypothetical protein